jgi:hypothetical protein
MTEADHGPGVRCRRLCWWAASWRWLGSRIFSSRCCLGPPLPDYGVLVIFLGVAPDRLGAAGAGAGGQ